MLPGEFGWLKGGIALGLLAALAVILIKPIGVSTQFVVTDTMIWSKIDPEIIQEKEVDGKKVLSSPNGYINKARASYARSAQNPINYSYIFVLSMIIGSLLSSITGGPRASKEDKIVPEAFRRRYGYKPAMRFAFAFIGGILALYGARLAGGCTSGHMISGMLQTSVSGYLFALGVFAAAIPTAILVYGTQKDKEA
jgi:hypothetical protein